MYYISRNGIHSVEAYFFLTIFNLLLAGLADVRPLKLDRQQSSPLSLLGSIISIKKTECPRRVHTKPMALQCRVSATKTIYKSRRQSGLGLRSWVASTLRELMMCPMSFRPFSVQKVRGREAARDSEFSTLLGWPAPQARGRRQSIQRLRDGEEERKWGGRAWGRVFHRLQIGSPFGYTGI